MGLVFRSGRVRSRWFLSELGFPVHVFFCGFRWIFLAALILLFAFNIRMLMCVYSYAPILLLVLSALFCRS